MRIGGQRKTPTNTEVPNAVIKVWDTSSIIFLCTRSEQLERFKMIDRDNFAKRYNTSTQKMIFLIDKIKT